MRRDRNKKRKGGKGRGEGRLAVLPPLRPSLSPNMFPSCCCRPSWSCIVLYSSLVRFVAVCDVFFPLAFLFSFFARSSRCRPVVCHPPPLAKNIPYALLRRTTLNRTCGTHKILYISIFLSTILGPIYHGPPYAFFVAWSNLFFSSTFSRCTFLRRTFLLLILWRSDLCSSLCVFCLVVALSCTTAVPYVLGSRHRLFIYLFIYLYVDLFIYLFIC